MIGYDVAAGTVLMPLATLLRESEYGDDWNTFNPGRYLDGSEASATVLKNGSVTVRGEKRMRSFFFQCSCLFGWASYCFSPYALCQRPRYDPRIFTFGGDFNTRNCVGKGLALQEMYLFGGRIFQCYELSAPEKLSQRLQPGLTNPPGDPHPVAFHRRANAAKLVREAGGVVA